jgi:N-acetylmuramic acid 6-phosphate etherase
MSAAQKTRDFLAIAPQFQLGHLVTESFHPQTMDLSELVKRDVPGALELLRSVDQEALKGLLSLEEQIWELAQRIQATLERGNKIFLCGCGATGRLSMVLETLYRQKHQLKGDAPVVSFMAGGDFALIKSVESFEDRTEYGQRQLLELGFERGDLLLAPTEGGETPFVIGATMTAASLGGEKPYFLYCNPDHLLRTIERSREVLDHDGINKLNLTVGPMAISGSTRMQASTVLMLAIGVGLLHQHADRDSFGVFYRRLLHELQSIPYAELAPLTSLEASLYQQDKYLNYVSDPDLAISILTDTTERSPTFSLRGFENRLDENPGHSLSYLFLDGFSDSAAAWRGLLSRDPRPLEWSELEGKINRQRILGFDISSAGLERRKAAIPHAHFYVRSTSTAVSFRCQESEVLFTLSSESLFRHLMVKMLLNAHSTIIMGILGRYEGNVMTWVRPSNNKLIDRAARYVARLLERQGKQRSYEEIVGAIFEEIEGAKNDEPVVLKVFRRLAV